MFVLTGGDLVLPDRVLSNGSLVVANDRIAAIEEGSGLDIAGARSVDVAGAWVLPGFIDVHVHGIEGTDTLDAGAALSTIAARLPRYGVTAFCPTTVACEPETLRRVLAQVATLRENRPTNAARVLPAHLESNFINPDYKGAQPAACLRVPSQRAEEGGNGEFTGDEILSAIADARQDVGIVTLAPELPGGLELVTELVTAGHHVSLGHSGANLTTAIAAIDAGAHQATHLFNRMSSMTHRAPGLVGAVLARQDVVAELICDGHHVHPEVSRIAIAAKGPNGIMAITDGTAGAGLRVGSTTRLGGRTIHVGEHAATLADGTLAGSTLTMDRAFRNLVTDFHCSIVAAAAMCSTTPANALGLTDVGTIATGRAADLVVIDRMFQVVLTMVDGEIAFRRG
jgi:N-acetylglucosamine-6-phosphate deacetylase